jgi:hypothetical protein
MTPMKYMSFHPASQRFGISALSCPMSIGLIHIITVVGKPAEQVEAACDELLTRRVERNPRFYGTEDWSEADPGLVPWVPLSKFEGPSGPLFQQCRAIIDQKAKPEEKENLLAVTQILARLRYNAEEAKALFGGDRPMIESPLLTEIVEEAMAKGKAEAKQQDIVEVLESRFTLPTPEMVSTLRSIRDLKKLDDLLRQALRCADLQTFENLLEK